jgi:hypothetical protein
VDGYLLALDERTSVECAGIPLLDLRGFLARLSELNVITEPIEGTDWAAKTNLRAMDVRIGALLEVCCARAGAEWTIAPAGAEPDAVVSILIAAPERIAELERAYPVAAKRVRKYRSELRRSLPSGMLERIPAAEREDE